MPELELHQQYTTAEQQEETYHFGMLVFLASEILLFTTLFTQYAYYRAMYGAEFVRAARDSDLVSGTIGTFVLVTSSFTMSMAVWCVRRSIRLVPTLLLFLTAALAAAFLALEFSEWAHDIAMGIMPGLSYHHVARPSSGARMYAGSFFMLTGLHALHVLGGAIVVLVLAVRSAQGAYSAERKTSLEMGSMFWHFVDVMWLFIWSCLYLAR
jgi:cytochrome c oxidase subunit 3